MNSEYLQQFLPDLDEFRKKTMMFHNGEITVPEYKGFSGGYGSYAQRGGKKHMLRLRMAGGRITKERLDFIVDAIDKYVDIIDRYGVDDNRSMMRCMRKLAIACGMKGRLLLEYEGKVTEI